tara:strand:- start:178 stop:1002 length:825 start_codon:yes stop_codon:yes gene_type:complete
MNLKIPLIAFMLTVIHINHAQTFTMGKKCRASLENAKTVLKSKNYTQALDQFALFSAKCRTKDAKEANAIGNAEAYNGLERYEEAIVEADYALKISKNKSLNGYFQKAVAQNKMGDIVGSKKSLNSVMELTENNKNITQRASNYALMAALYERQLNETDSAQIYLDKAKALDPNNVNILIQEGSMYSTKKDFVRAFESYDKAQNMDPENIELSISRSNTRLRMMEEKYGTKKAQELRMKMSPDEKKTLCDDLNKAKSLGYKNMNRELFMALICN